MSRQQVIASNAPGTLLPGDNVIPRCERPTVPAISDRRACEHRTSCRAPDDNARSGHRSWSASLSTCGDNRPTVFSTE